MQLRRLNLKGQLKLISVRTYWIHGAGPFAKRQQPTRLAQFFSSKTRSLLEMIASANSVQGNCQITQLSATNARVALKLGACSCSFLLQNVPRYSRASSESGPLLGNSSTGDNLEHITSGQMNFGLSDMDRNASIVTELVGVDGVFIRVGNLLRKAHPIFAVLPRVLQDENRRDSDKRLRVYAALLREMKGKTQLDGLLEVINDVTSNSTGHNVRQLHKHLEYVSGLIAEQTTNLNGGRYEAKSYKATMTGGTIVVGMSVAMLAVPLPPIMGLGVASLVYTILGAVGVASGASATGFGAARTFRGYSLEGYRAALSQLQNDILNLQQQYDKFTSALAQVEAYDQAYKSEDAGSSVDLDHISELTAAFFSLWNAYNSFLAPRVPVPVPDTAQTMDQLVGANDALGEHNALLV